MKSTISIKKYTHHREEKLKILLTHKKTQKELRKEIKKIQSELDAWDNVLIKSKKVR